MAFENLKSTGIAYLLGKIKTFLSDTYVKIADSVRTVNDVEPDANGNIKIDTVQYAQNLESESSQRNVQTFIQRTSGGTAPIESGDGWLMLLKGNSVHSGYVAESINLTVTPAEREEGETPITATIDRDTFVAYVEDSGTTTLVYSTAWSADPTLYGITVTGTPVAGDVLTVVYVKEERGTITVAEPGKFVSTGWNLYDSVAGYAKVVKYEYGYTITGTYTSAKYAATPTGTQIDITITDGKFNIPDDGYIIVTGGNSTDTAIFPYWTDWTDGYDGEFAVYSKDEIDLSGLFGESKPFPYGLLKVGDVTDEIDLNIGVATSRIDRMDYSAENLATAQASGRAYEYDEDYIYIVRASAVVTSISVDGAITSDDHGIEYFTDTEVPVYAELLYGNNLKNKLETNVLTISQQSLTSGQKSQVKSNLGFANQSDLDTLNSNLNNSAFPIASGSGTSSGENFNNKTIPGVYTVSSNATAGAITNCPVAKAGRLCVWSPTSSALNSAWAVGEQIYYVPADGDEYRRRSVADGSGVITWGAWESLKNNIIKRKDFDVTGTTGTTLRGGLYNSGGIALPNVSGTVLGIVINQTFDTSYNDRHCFATVYNETSITVWAVAAERGVRVKGYILYI